MNKYLVLFINNRCYIDVINQNGRFRRGTGIYEPDIARQKLIKKRLFKLMMEQRATVDNVFEIVNRYVNDKLLS